MKPYLITGKPGYPLHPLAEFLNALPEWPGLWRASWNGFAPPAAQAILDGWKCKEPLPEKGKVLTISFPVNPGDTESLALVRIHKTSIRTPDNKHAMYAFEAFKRKP